MAERREFEVAVVGLGGIGSGAAYWAAKRAAVGQGAAHAFKFASAFGRSLVELVFDGKAESDVRAWTIERDVLTAKDPPRHLGL